MKPNLYIRETPHNTFFWLLLDPSTGQEFARSKEFVKKAEALTAIALFTGLFQDAARNPIDQTRG